MGWFSRVVLVSALTLFLVTAIGVCRSPLTRPPERAQIETLRERLHGLAAARMDAGQWARADGSIYAVDVAQLAVYAARCADARLYERLRRLMIEWFLFDDPNDAFTRGFVAWRYHGAEPADASGTTEALRIAEAFVLGAETFGRPEDRDRAVLNLRGYARHAYVDRGTWFVRNYFNFQTRTFATNSYLIDYDPDLLDQVAASMGDAELSEVAERSVALRLRASEPSSLIH